MEGKLGKVHVGGWCAGSEEDEDTGRRESLCDEAEGAWEPVDVSDRGDIVFENGIIMESESWKIKGVWAGFLYGKLFS